MEMEALFLLQFGVVPEQLVEATTESEENQRVDKEELDNIDNHSS